MLVLEGDQGTLKSTACKVLAGGNFFSDSMPENVAGKDAALHLRGKWLIEMAEMHALSKSETTALKAFLTRDTDIYRPPYGRLEVYEPRQCVFIGTTNKSEYLKDETGGRRFWPVKCGVIRPDALAADRDQLLAEALDTYRSGQHWWPDAAFEREHIQPQQAARYVTDVWQQLVENYVEHEGRVTVLQVAREALDLKTDKIGTAEQRRISAILEAAGWKRAGRTGKARWWMPSVTDDAQ
jgi:predicted P-loop ATPase